jgi:hypothetical protein
MGKASRENLEWFVATHRAKANLKALEEYSNVPYEVLLHESLNDVEHLSDADLKEEAEAWKND